MVASLIRSNKAFAGCSLLLVGYVLSGCTANAPVAGPDKQAGGTIEGAITGAGAGAVTGFQISAATGPGAALGAGFGAVLGGVRGAVLDGEEERSLAIAAEAERERERIGAQRVLSGNLERRLNLHAGRDIYPADVFFGSGSVDLCPAGEALVTELARMLQDRLSWSRLSVVAYTVSRDKRSVYGNHLSQGRAITIVNELIRRGLEPRRLVASAKVVKNPILIDSTDHPARFSEAIEIVLLDN